jgi:hypothetical protein
MLHTNMEVKNQIYHEIFSVTQSFHIHDKLHNNWFFQQIVPWNIRGNPQYIQKN